MSLKRYSHFVGGTFSLETSIKTLQVHRLHDVKSARQHIMFFLVHLAKFLIGPYILC